MVYPAPQACRWYVNVVISVAMITTVFFDAGNTLLKAHPSVAHLYADTARRYGSDPAHEDLMAQFKNLRKEIAPMAARQDQNPAQNIGPTAEKSWWREFVYRLFERVGMVNDFDAFFEDLYHVFSRKESWRLYPEVLDVLEKLRRRSLKLFIVSNWDSRLTEICRDLGLTSYFQEIIISSLVGHEKPDPAIYRIALRSADIEPEAVLHVGDDREMDFLAARSLGLQALLVDRDHRYEPQPFRITSLTGVLTFLENNGQ